MQHPPYSHVSTGVQQGDILGGKYRIERVLGAGGMGVVAAATHLQLDERVAIKFLLPDALTNSEALARFEREARAAVKIKSEHVARVIDVGTLETGAPFMVMEFLEGEDLAQRVRARGALPIEETVDFVLQACEAIAEAHTLGIVHRDLKPANLFVSKRPGGMPIVKVLDFGISKITSMGGSGPDMSMTRTTAVMGSPHYMSPEQMASTRDVDGRTDIWALGAILFELLTGKVPFEATTIPQLCAMVLQTKAPPLRSRRPDAPEGLEWAVARCLEKDLSKRFANVGELARALAEFGSRNSQPSVERIAQILSQAGAMGGTMLIDGRSSFEDIPTDLSFGRTNNRQRSRRTAVAAVLGALVAIVTVVYLLTRSGAGEQTVASPAANSGAALPAERPSEPRPGALPEGTTAVVAPTHAPDPGPPTDFFPPQINANPTLSGASTNYPPATSRPRPLPAAGRPRPRPPATAPAAPPAPTDDLGGRL